MAPKVQEKLSWVPLQIELLYNEESLGLGTAFFYELGGDTYLITNWHNVSGRHPDTLKPGHKYAALPNKLRLFYPQEETVATVQNPEGEKLIRWYQANLDLYENDIPVWFEHPEHGNAVDVVAIKLGIKNTKICMANSEELELTDIILRPSLDVFVLGYPLGLTGGARLPIWKRGSIASEPEIPLEGLPKFFIDTATKKGMSGSPVYVQSNGMNIPNGGNGFKDAILGEVRKFVGIYSGRVGASDFEAQLGIVWSEQAIIDTISGKRNGTSSFEL